jgi:integrase
MASSITVRRRASGEKRYVVRYRRGGRAYPIEHAGSFRTLKEAKLRRDFVAGELAAGRDPAAALRALREQPPTRTLSKIFDEFVTSRIDVSAATIENYKTQRGRLLDALGGDRDPDSITWQDVQATIVTLSTDLAPSSLRPYLSTLRQVLDFAELDPNPARDRRVKLPRLEKKIVEPPSGATVAAIISNTPKRWRLAIRTLEQTGMRVSELADLAWCDVDAARSRFRVHNGKTTAARRWVAVPGWLMVEITNICPPDDRTPERKLFPGATRQTIGMAMRKACANAGLSHHHPHDLRHRYASVKIREGVPVTHLAAQLGHSRTSMTLDTYSHVLLEEDD